MKAYSSSCSQTVSLCPAVFTKDWPTMVHSVRLVINNNLGSISHCYWDTATYWPKIANFSHLPLI